MGISTNSHTFVQDTSISATVTDVIAPDANGKIFFNTTNDGLHGASLAWIRNRNAGSERNVFTGTERASGEEQRSDERRKTA